MRILILYLLILSTLTVQAQSDTFLSLSDKANSLIEEQKYEEALVCFEKAIAIGSDNKESLAWTAVTAGICAQQIGDLSRAFQFFEIAITNNCADEDIYERYLRIASELNDPATLEQALQIARKNRDTDHKYTVRLMNHYYNAEQYEKTIQLVDTLLYEGNQQVQFYNIKGMSLQKINKQEESVPVYKKALEIAPSDFNSLRQLGLIYYEKATDLYNNTMKSYQSISNPTKAQYNSVKDKVKKATGYYQESAAFLEKAAQVQPADETVKDYLARAKKKAGQK